MSKRKPTWKTMAKKHIGKPAMYGGGDGPFAFVTPCRVVYYTLWETRQEADTRKARVDRTGCCGGCRPWTHYIVDLEESK